VIRRVIAGATLALTLALVPATAAQAQVTRPIQAFDTPTFRTIFTPRNNVPAQVGDTVQFRLTQPGNVNASTHDVWLQAPGGQPQFLGISYETPVVNAPLSQAGTYSFFCSIHGGQAAGGMNGTILVTTTNPGPPVDPGQPWTDPDWEDPEYPGDGPLPLPNDTEAPTVFEEGDNDAPLLNVIGYNRIDERTAVRVRFDVSEPGFVTLRLKQGKKVVRTKIVEVEEEGVDTAVIKLPFRLQDRERRYKLEVWATDLVEIDSAVHSFNVRLGHS
jgi:plastocyanin